MLSTQSNDVSRSCFRIHSTSVNLTAVSSSYARTHNQRQRVEKVLHRRALHLAGAKAQSDQELIAKYLPFVSPEHADLEMEHVDATSPSCSTTLDATTSSEETGLALSTLGTSRRQRTLDHKVEGVDIGTLRSLTTARERS